MTKNEKLNSLKDLEKFYEEEIINLKSEVETLTETHSRTAYEIIANVSRSEKRFLHSFYRLGGTLLISMFTIGVLSSSPLSFILCGALGAVSIADFTLSIIDSNKHEKESKNLKNLENEYNVKINNINNKIKGYENKLSQVKNLIDKISNELYFGKPTATANANKQPIVNVKTNNNAEITK